MNPNNPSMRRVSPEEMTANARLRGGGASDSARAEHEEGTYVLVEAINERASIALERRLLSMLVEA
jgi:hypothetical protein